MAQRIRSLVVPLFVLWAVAVAGLAAHHGWGEYDSRRPTTLTGTITATGYENLHAFVDLDVSGKSWHAVLAPPSRMQARGVTREMLKESNTVTVIGFPPKSRSTELKAERITVGDKTTYIR